MGTEKRVLEVPSSPFIMFVSFIHGILEIHLENGPDAYFN